MRLIFATAFLATFGASAFAHSYLERAEPAAGSTVSPPPAFIRMIFGSPLETGFAKIRVQRDGDDIEALPEPNLASDGRMLTVSLPNPIPGAYKVFWSVVAKDGHRTAGDFVFSAQAK